MSNPETQPRRRYKWADYQTWHDDKRWEIIGGEAFLMASPTSRHQIISMELSRQMANHFKGRNCRPFAAPMDVVLTDDDVVQPDLFVVCNPTQIKRTPVEGPPTLCVEVVSDPSINRLLKLDLYARSGVKEYWLVTPWPSLIEVLLLQGRKYLVHRAFGKHDALVSPTFPDLTIALGDVFNFPLEPGEEPPVAHEPPAPRYAAPTR
jgi:Uma2 family endonuclease